MAAPFTLRLASLTEEEMSRVVYVWSSSGTFMQRRRLGQKKNEWILYAFIIQKNGGEASLEHIKDKLTLWKKRNASSRTIAARINMNKKNGFEKVREDWVQKNGGFRRYVSIYSFKGDLPDIHKSTLQLWESKLSPKGDKPKN